MNNVIPQHPVQGYYNMQVMGDDLVRLVSRYCVLMNKLPLTDKTAFRLVGIQNDVVDIRIRDKFNEIRKHPSFKEFSFRLTTEAGFTGCILVTITRKPRKPVTKYFNSYDLISG